MAKIIGNTIATPNPRPDWLQTDASKADFILNKPELNDVIRHTEQSLSENEKAQVRANIGAGTSSVELATNLETPGKAADAKLTGDTIAALLDSTETNYNESIIGLSIDGQIITYIKGDGSVHTIVTQDTNTTYSLGTDETTGLTKLYATTGSAEDGTMTQKAIKTELDKKVGVSIDTTNNTLIFTI